ncbi:uncharacterized protein LOC112452330 [Temnothorax curvispinosus]|uniref:Uncharacterized protein LOC112452330 n=1 Tax=Temnothorax curvispinosus TaxID=300111 RepID=A0A6J1PFB9_9HYME|nr:uncharacterized protein LOC112452330 [Temnothorax curvispinosus]
MVAKRFKSLRDTFQKERKKVLANIPSSGAGVQDGNTRYESTWEYYKDLLFLSEHINSRTTISNYSGHSDSESVCPETQSDDSQFWTNETDSCTNVLKRKASQPLIFIEMTEENESAIPENIVYKDTPSVSLQCTSSSGDNESLLSDESNKNSCVSLAVLKSSVPIIEVQRETETLPTKISGSQCEASYLKSPLLFEEKR